jgi:hypothetical protein
VIRFSAALVAVAVGVLIGGIATSKLLLVYIAIVVSAVALVALAIGVVLKREELFGEVPGLVPAGAAASPVPPGDADITEGHAHNKTRPAVAMPAMVAGSPGVTASSGAPVVIGPGTAAGAGTRTASSGTPVAAPPWETAAAPTAWSAPAATTRPSATVGPSTPASPAADSPSWFGRLDPSAAPTGPAPVDPAPVTPAPADNDDDDWPARYSWLDDDEDEGADAGLDTGAGAEPAATGDAAGAAAEPAAWTAATPAADPAATPSEPLTAEAAAAPSAASEAADESEADESEAAESEAAEATLVAVVSGVPRYHAPDCVLIRFLPDGEARSLTIREAEAEGCTPCAACQPPASEPTP